MTPWAMAAIVILGTIAAVALHDRKLCRCEYLRLRVTRGPDGADALVVVCPHCGREWSPEGPVPARILHLVSRERR